MRKNVAERRWRRSRGNVSTADVSSILVRIKPGTKINYSQKVVTTDARAGQISVVDDPFDEKRLSGGHHGDMPFMIRRADPSEWEAYRSIRLRSLFDEPDAYESDYETEAGLGPDRWKRRLADAATFLAFDDDHAVIGTATGIWTGDDDTVLVVGMYVAPLARGRGCARQMLDAIAHLASSLQRKRLVLGVADSNTRAARLYRWYGFVDTGRRRQLRDSNITEIELAFRLPPEQATRDRR